MQLTMWITITSIGRSGDSGTKRVWFQKHRYPQGTGKSNLFHPQTRMILDENAETPPGFWHVFPWGLKPRDLQGVGVCVFLKDSNYDFNFQSEITTLPRLMRLPCDHTETWEWSNIQSYACNEEAFGKSIYHYIPQNLSKCDCKEATHCSPNLTADIPHWSLQ